MVAHSAGDHHAFDIAVLSISFLAPALAD